MRKKFYVLKHGFGHRGTSGINFSEKILGGSGSVNPFRAELFFEKRQFSAKFLKFQNALAPSILELEEN